MTSEETFGQHLKQLRLARGLSLRRAAELVNIGHMRLSELEDGKTKATGRPTRARRQLVEKFAEAYQVGAGGLLELAGYPVDRPALSADEVYVLELLRCLEQPEFELALRLLESISRYAGLKKS